MLVFETKSTVDEKAIAAVAEIVKRAAAAQHAFAEDVMADSKEHYVPVDTGYLRSTGHVDPTEVRSTEAVTTMGYSADYAAPVHDNMAAHHPHGQAGYLSTPLLTRVKELASRIADAVKG